MQGVYTIEFAIIGLLLFTVLFGVLEMGRLYFTVNALNESARRGARLAAVCDIRDPVILHRAIFNAAADAGSSDLIANLQPGNLALGYLDENGSPIADPSPTGNFTAIRFVQLTITGFTLDLFIPALGGEITLPTFRAILPRESLGRSVEGDTEC